MPISGSELNDAGWSLIAHHCKAWRMAGYEQYVEVLLPHIRSRRGLTSCRTVCLRQDLNSELRELCTFQHGMPNN